MGISLVLFKKSSFNSKKIKKSLYLNLLNLSKKDFAMQKSSLKFHTFSSKKNEKVNKERGTIRPWVKIYFLNQEIQYQIYKNYRFSNKNYTVFEKITKISLFGELNLIYFILNKFSMEFINPRTLKSKNRKANRTSNFFLNERFIDKNLDKRSFYKNLFFLNVNSFKSWFFYFFNKKNKNLYFSQTFLKNLKRFSSKSEKVFYKSSTLSYKNIKTLSTIPSLQNKSNKLKKDEAFVSKNFSGKTFKFLKKKRNLSFSFINKNNINKSYQFSFSKISSMKSTFLNLQLIKKSSFLIKKLFYKVCFFNFLQACFKTHLYFQLIPINTNKKSILSFYEKNFKYNKTKLRNSNLETDPLFFKKVAKLNFEVTKNKHLLKQNVSLFENLIKLLECLSFEPKFLLYLRCGKNNLALNNQFYLNQRKLGNKKKIQIIQSRLLLNSNFLKIGKKYFNTKNIFLLKNRLALFQSYFREKRKFFSKGKNSNVSYLSFSNLKVLNQKILREFLTDSKQTKNHKNLFVNFTDSFSLNKMKQRNDSFFHLTFYKLFLNIHENLNFLRQSKNYFLLKILTFKFDSIFKNYLFSKKTFHLIHRINSDFFLNFEFFKSYKKLKNFNFYQTKRKKLSEMNSFYFTNINLKLIGLKKFKKLRDLSVLLILDHKLNEKLIKLKKKGLREIFKSHDSDLSNFDFLCFINPITFTKLKFLSFSPFNKIIKETKVCEVFKQVNSMKKLFFYKKSIMLITLNLSQILKENGIYYLSFSNYGILSILLKDNSLYKKQNHMIPIKIVQFFYKKLSFLEISSKLNQDEFRFEFSTKRLTFNNLNKNLYDLMFFICNLQKKKIIFNDIKKFYKSLKFKNVSVIAQQNILKPMNRSSLNVECTQIQFQLFLKKMEFTFPIYRCKLLISTLKNKKSTKQEKFLIFSNFLNLEKLNFIDSLLNGIILLMLQIQRIEFENQLNQSFFSYGQNFLFFAKNSNFLRKNKIHFCKMLSNSNLRIKQKNFFYTSLNMGNDYFSPKYPSSLKFLNPGIKLSDSKNLRRDEHLRSLPGFVFFGFYILQKFKVKRFLNVAKSKTFKFRKKENYKISVIPTLYLTENLFEDSLPEFFTKREIYFSKSLKKNDKFGFFELFLLPSTLNLRDHANQMKTLILKSQGKSQLSFIKNLSPLITKWSHYYSFENKNQAILNLEGTKKNLKTLNFLLVKRLWKWSLKRHNKMSNIWIKNKYFFSINNQKALFSTKVSFPINGMALISKLDESKFRSSKNKKTKDSIYFSKIKLVFIILPKYS